MKTTGLQRVINCLKAEKRATEPSFQNFWKNTMSVLFLELVMVIVVIISFESQLVQKI